MSFFAFVWFGARIFIRFQNGKLFLYFFTRNSYGNLCSAGIRRILLWGGIFRGWRRLWPSTAPQVWL